jgi:hypothetical protein
MTGWWRSPAHCAQPRAKNNLDGIANRATTEGDARKVDADLSGARMDRSRSRQP